MVLHPSRNLLQVALLSVRLMARNEFKTNSAAELGEEVSDLLYLLCELCTGGTFLPPPVRICQTCQRNVRFG
jgi:hypothetical protein